MRAITPKQRQQIDEDPFYKVCCRRSEGNCGGRITIEHVFIYAGRQIAEMWNYIPLCEYHHGVLNYQDGGDLNKEINAWVALNRATDAELLPYSKATNYIEMRSKLNNIYGTRS